MPPCSALGRQLILFAFLAARMARAQESAEHEQQQGALGRPAAGENIDVVGEKPAGSPRAPAAASTVTETSEFGGEVRSVSELLATTPGITVHALGGPGQAATVSLRGASADESLVLLDGIPLQGPGGGSIDLGTVPALLLDRVIVSRGVLGGQFGAGALGGAIELLPRLPRDRWTGGAQISTGSFGTAQAAADLAAPIGTGGNVLAAVQGDRTNGRFQYARQATPEIPGSPYYGYERQNADATRGSALVRVTQPAIGPTELNLLLQGSGGERGLPGPVNAPTNEPRELDAGGVASVQLRGNSGDVAWSARAWGRLDRIELRGVQRFQQCQDGTPSCPRMDQRSSGGRGEGEVSLPLGESSRFAASLSGGEESVHGTGTGAHARAVASAMLRDDFAAAGGAFSLHPAIRFDKIGADLGLSPALTASVRPLRETPFELRAGFGLSFRAATMSELYLNRGGIEANPQLRPERAWSLDAGAAWRGKRLLLSAGVFFSSYRDLILYELHPSANAVTPSNIGSALISGLELQAVVPLLAGVFVEAAYSFLSAINHQAGEQHGQQLAYRPPHRLFLRLARHGDRLEGYAEASYTSATPRNEFGVLQGNQLLFNAGAGVRAAGPLWIDVEVKNLLDDQTLEDLFQYPLPGRSIAVIARARL